MFSNNSRESTSSVLQSQDIAKCKNSTTQGGEKKKRVKERVQKRKKEKNKIKCNNYIKIGS